MYKMFNVIIKLLQNRFLISMNEPQDKCLNETTKLLRRLKITYNISANAIKNDYSQRRSNFTNKNPNNEIQTIRFNQSAVQKVPLPPIFNTNKNTFLTTSVINNKKSAHNFGIHEANMPFLNKIGARSFSTLGRFLSTPSGTKSEEFLSELSQNIRSGKIKKIIVMAGAGISCPSGIPDFRTQGSGLYDNLQQYNIPYPEAIFDINYFMVNPKPFFILAKDLFPSGKYRPNKVHYFLKLLQEKKLLLRVYTQNIDGLERLAGVSDAFLVEAHGTFASGTCIQCGDNYDGDYVKTNIDKFDISRCSKCKGIVKPDIVFFGENLPARFHMHSSDFRQADLLFVMGTSLEVEPFASIVDSTRFSVPRVLLNKQSVGVFRSKRRMYDHCLLGDIIDNIGTLVKILGWEDELNTVIKTGEANKVNFLDTINRSKPPTNTRNYSTLSYIRQSRPTMQPLIPIRSNNRMNIRCNDTNRDARESSSDSDSTDSTGT